MTPDFPERFISIVNQIESSLPHQFKKSRMVDYDGKIAALSANFCIEKERKWMGLLSTSKSSHCHEFRLVYSCPVLTSDILDDWWNFVCTQQEKLIPIDETHEFSFISLILICSEVENSVIKQLKKLNNELHYNKKDKKGWTSARMAVIDLEKNKIYPSRKGDFLRDTLKNIKLA